MGAGSSIRSCLKNNSKTNNEKSSALAYAVPNDERSAEILLRERIKELLSLYSVSTLTSKQPRETGDATEVFQSVLNVLAASFKYPDSTSAHINIVLRNDISSPSKTSRELAASCPLSSLTVVAMSTVAPATITAAIKCEDVVLGTIEMRSHAPMPPGLPMGSPSESPGGSPGGSKDEGYHERSTAGRHSHQPTFFNSVLLNDVAAKLSDYLTRAAQNDKLLERQKILACLHRTTQYSIGDGEHGMRQFLTSIIGQIKESMQFPAICDIEIRLFCAGEGKEIVVSTPLFDKKKWTLQTNITLPGTNAHTPIITVDYDDKGVEIPQSKLKKTARMMSALKNATERCVAIENFEAAKELKEMKNQMTAMERALANMETDKLAAIAREDYITASMLRDEIQRLSDTSQVWGDTTVRTCESIGTVIVSYRRPKLIEESPVDPEHPWLDEERSLLQSICSQLALMVHSRGSDTLLSSMLPTNIAQTLRINGSIRPTSHTCTILFTDIVGFTQMSSESAPEAIFDMLNDLYTRFDALVENRGDKLYKVETIGDAYMVVSGLPVEMENESHASEIAQLAIRLMEAVQTVSITTLDGTIKPIHIRCGIHSGDVVAGVVGRVNPRYCLFGDAVNIASRMESSSEEMRVHCSKSTFECLSHEEERGNGLNAAWELVPRGGIEIKGKGNMETWWIERRATEIVQYRRRNTGSMIEQKTAEIESAAVQATRQIQEEKFNKDAKQLMDEGTPEAFESLRLMIAVKESTMQYNRRNSDTYSP